MRTKLLKNLGLFSSGIVLNGYIMYEALKANESHNNYLAKLPPVELEKLKARNWYLEKNGSFFGSGVPILERMAIDQYKAMPTKEQDKVLREYRRELEFDQIKRRWELNKITSEMRMKSLKKETNKESNSEIGSEVQAESNTTTSNPR